METGQKKQSPEIKSISGPNWSMIITRGNSSRSGGCYHVHAIRTFAAPAHSCSLSVSPRVRGGWLAETGWSSKQWHFKQEGCEPSGSQPSVSVETSQIPRESSLGIGGLEDLLPGNVADDFIQQDVDVIAAIPVGKPAKTESDLARFDSRFVGEEDIRTIGNVTDICFHCLS